MSSKDINNKEIIWKTNQIDYMDAEDHDLLEYLHNCYPCTNKGFEQAFGKTWCDDLNKCTNDLVNYFKNNHNKKTIIQSLKQEQENLILTEDTEINNYYEIKINSSSKNYSYDDLINRKLNKEECIKYCNKYLKLSNNQFFRIDEPTLIIVNYITGNNEVEVFRAIRNSKDIKWNILKNILY